MKKIGYIAIRFLRKIRLLNNITIVICQKFYRALSSSPSSLQIHTTTQCNLSCDYCYADRSSQVDLIDWLQVLKDAARIKTRHIDFLGGEPLLDRRIKEYLVFCWQHKMTTTVHTNGLLISEDLLCAIKKFRGAFTFSIKFDVKVELDKLFGKEHYSRVIEVIDLCQRNNIKIQIHSFIHKNNYNKIIEMIDFANQKKIFLTIERYMDQGILEIDQKYSICKEEWNVALKEYQKYCNCLSKDALIVGSIKGNGCSCYLDLISVNAKGMVSPCPFASDQQAIGNVQKESLRSIWKRYQKLSREVWMKIPEECKSCKNKYFCHGGCKTHVFAQNRHYDAKDPFCQDGRVPMGIFIRPR